MQVCTFYSDAGILAQMTATIICKPLRYPLLSNAEINCAVFAEQPFPVGLPQGECGFGIDHRV